MKIAFISQPWNKMIPPVEAGSVAIWTYEVARRLAASHDVVVYGKASWRQQRVRHHEGIEYRYVWTGADARLLRMIGRVPWARGSRRPLFSWWLYYLGYILQVAMDLQKRCCDVVHIHNFAQFAPVVRALNPHLPIVLHSHCEWLNQLGRRPTARRLGKTNLIVGCSKYIVNKIKLRFPKLANRCRVVPNGVDVDSFANDISRRPGKRLVFVGRLSPEKGLHVLLEAFESVARQHADAHLDLIGPSTPASENMEFTVKAAKDDSCAELEVFRDVDYLQHLQGMVKPGLAGRVHFIGPVSHSELVDHLKDADVFINPSYTDAFPLTVLEAMCCSLPVVATSVGGTPEAVVDNETGILVRSGDALALAEGVNRLLDSAGMIQAMGKAARERIVRCFSWERVAELLLERYREVVEELCAQEAG